MDTVDGVAHVLPRRHDEREGEQGHHREGVVQPEYRAVDVDVADLDQVLEAAEDVQHDWTSERLLFGGAEAVLQLHCGDLAYPILSYSMLREIDSLSVSGTAVSRRVS